MSDHRYYIVPVSPIGKKKKELAEQIRNYMRPLQNSPKSPKFPPRHLGDFP